MKEESVTDMADLLGSVIAAHGGLGRSRDRSDVHTENSHKYRPDAFEALVERGGWRVKTAWTSDAPSFGVFPLDTEG